MEKGELASVKTRSILILPLNDSIKRTICTFFERASKLFRASRRSVKTRKKHSNKQE